MMRLATVITLFDDLSEAELSVWIARQWVRPEGEEGDWHFAEPHLARIRLIHELHRTMAVPEDTLSLVLSLLDQLHAARSTLAAVADALADQPPEIQAIVRAALDRRLP